MVAESLLVVVMLLGAGKPGAKPAKEKAAEALPAPPPEPAFTAGAGTLDEPRKAAEAYLHALAGDGDDRGKDLLLGGATLTAQDFHIPNWRIAERQTRVETGSLADAVGGMRAIDDAAKATLKHLGESVNNDDVKTLSKEQAEKALAPTRELSERLAAKHPVFAYAARTGKNVFWHPENPWRRVIEKLGTEGDYRLEMHVFRIEEKEDGRKPRVWPLRVLRVKSASYDSGWKVLPASDWNPEY